MNQRITVSGWTQWLRVSLHDDTKGYYVSFSLNTDHTQEELIKKWEAHCPEGCFVFLLVAYSWSGRKHYHGLCRFPKSDEAWRPFVIRQGNHTKKIDVPNALYQMLKNLETQNEESAFGDLHLMNDGQRVKLLIHKSDAAEAILKYWSKTSDGEIRDFSAGMYFPHANRRKIRVRKGRPRCRERVVQPRRSRTKHGPDRLAITPEVLHSATDAYLVSGGTVETVPPVIEDRRHPRGPVPQPYSVKRSKGRDLTPRLNKVKRPPEHLPPFR